MSAWEILFIIIAVILILLMCPLKLFIEYNGELKLFAGYLFLKFQLVPEKPKKPKKKKQQPKKPEEKKETPQPRRRSRFRRLMDKHGLSGLIDILMDIKSIVTDTLKKTAKHLYITRCNIRICVVGEDAAQTAIQYGYVCSAVYPVLSVLTESAVLKKHYTDISAGFLAEKTAAEMELTAKIRPLFLIPIALKALFKLALKLRELT